MIDATPSPPWTGRVLALRDDGAVDVAIAALDRGQLARRAAGGSRILRPDDVVLVDADELGQYVIVSEPFAAGAVTATQHTITGNGTANEFTFDVERRPGTPPAVWDVNGNLIEVTVMYDADEQQLILAFGSAPPNGTVYEVDIVS